ncbi:hypothetical protein C8R45DRAFT_971934, partial [Mycena sanguinolenta]
MTLFNKQRSRAGFSRALASRIYTHGLLLNQRFFRQSASGLTKVQYLTIDVRALCDATVPFPLLFTVTHLELLAFGIESVPLVCRNISLIPRLTHIALNQTLDSLLSHATLCANTHLQCIVFLSPGASLDGSPLIDDDRFVCIDEGAHYHDDWLNGTVFGEDYWALADTFLAARRAGTIDRSRYHITNKGNLHRVRAELLTLGCSSPIVADLM